MSANKKISQNELRKFMYAQKRKALESLKRIESPLAKYSETGVLTCIVCNSIVKTEAVWNVHINSKQHKENISRKNQIIAEVPKQELPQEKKPIPVHNVTKKPVKSILKNAVPLPPTFFDDVKVEPDVEYANPAKKIKIEEQAEDKKTENGPDEIMETDTPRDSELPEGFFDDPILDAKARNVEYKDPVEEEWEKFQKEIKEETDLSAKLIHEDTEDATAQRQFEEIDEQLSKLERVMQLEKMKQAEVKARALNKVEVKKEEPSADDSDDSDLDVEFDWRAKSYLS